MRQCWKPAGSDLHLAALVVLSISTPPPALHAQQVSERIRSHSQSGALPGQAQGTKQYLVALTTRSYEPKTLLAQARAEPDPLRRKQILAALVTAAEQDQADVRVAPRSWAASCARASGAETPPWSSSPRLRCNGWLRTAASRKRGRTSSGAPHPYSQAFRSPATVAARSTTTS